MAEQNKKSPQFLLRGFLLTSVVVLLLFLSPVFFPNLLLSDTVMYWVQKILISEGVALELQWKQRSVRWRAWGELQFDVGFEKVCVRAKKSDVCFHEGKGTLVVGLFPVFKIEELGPLNIARAELSVRNEGENEKVKGPSSPTVVSLPTWLRPRRVDVQLKQANVEIFEDQRKWIEGSLSLMCSRAKAGAIRCEIPARVNVASNDFVYKRMNARLEFENKSDHWDFALKGEASGVATSHILSVDLKGTKKLGHETLFQGSVGGRWNRAPWQLRLQGALSDEGKQLDLTTRGFVSPLALEKKYRRHLKESIQLQKCSLSASFESNTSVKMQGCTLEVPLAAGLGGRPRFEWEGEVVLPAQRGRLAVTLPQQAGKLYAGSGFLSARFEKREKGMHLKVDPQSTLSIEVPRFQKVVALLDDSPFAVPAPFNALSGSVGVQLQAQPEGSTKLKLPLSLKTDLRSARQALKLDGKGMFAIDWGAELSGKLELDLVVLEGKFEAPPLSLTGVPSILPDSRIHPRQVPEATGPDRFAFSYVLRIRTADKARVYVANNLLPQPLPLGFDFNIQSEAPFTGTLTVHPVRVMLFRREARVRQLHFSWVPTGKKADVVELRGRIDVNYPDYSVNVGVTGTSDRPRISLGSSPPLTRQEIIALLLFGDESLGSEQQNSVSSFDAAVAQRSLGLAALYILARTPIQSISFDPRTQAVTANVRVGQNTTVNLTGGSQGNKRVGFSRRIGKNWAVTTEVPLGDSTGSGPSGISGFLEWFNRF